MTFIFAISIASMPILLMKRDMLVLICNPITLWISLPILTALRRLSLLVSLNNSRFRWRIQTFQSSRIARCLILSLLLENEILLFSWATSTLIISYGAPPASMLIRVRSLKKNITDHLFLFNLLFSPTFISHPIRILLHFTIINLTLALTSSIASLYDIIVLLDLFNDHYPIEIQVNCLIKTAKIFSYKIIPSQWSEAKQYLHDNASTIVQSIDSIGPDPLLQYDTFCNLVFNSFNTYFLLHSLADGIALDSLVRLTLRKISSFDSLVVVRMYRCSQSSQCEALLEFLKRLLGIIMSIIARWYVNAIALFANLA